MTSAPVNAWRRGEGAVNACRNEAPYRRARSLHAGLPGAPPYTSPRVTLKVPSNNIIAKEKFFFF